MIRLREIKLETDYPMVAGWWKAHGWHEVPQAILPKLGVMAHFDDLPTAAAWLYMDNSVGVCWLEWLVSNPAAKPYPAIRCISQVIGFLKERALEMDYGVMMTTCRQDTLVRLYERNGFLKTDEGVTHLLMPLREPKET
jgi:hypothetical protein